MHSITEIEYETRTCDFYVRTVYCKFRKEIPLLYHYLTLFHPVQSLRTSVEEPLFPCTTLQRAQVQLYFPL